MARQRRLFSHSPKIVLTIFVSFFLLAVWIYSERLIKPPQVVTPNADEQVKLDRETDAKLGEVENDGKLDSEETDAKLGEVDNDGKLDSEETHAKLGEEDNEKINNEGDNEVKQDLKHDKYMWKLCKGGADYIPCLDNEEAIKMLPSRSHYEHRERHCPTHEDLVTCLAPLPESYKRPIPWPQSRDEIWLGNVPHLQLVTYKKDQSWVKQKGDKLVFPGTGTQFVLGANHYIDYIEKTLPDIEWGKHTRVILDVGCGVASFGGYLFQKDVLTMSFAPKDEHEAQVQFALERGIPAISAVMGTQRLVFPANVFDMVHCARCRVPWHADGGKLLLEVNRVLRPGGYFVWSAPPVYRNQPDQVQIWKNTSSLAASMCWNQLARTTDSASSVGVAIFQKPHNNLCYERRRSKHPPLCIEDDKPDAAWYIPMQTCIHKVPVNEQEHGSSWPEEWPQRLETPPNWLNYVSRGVYGKPGHNEFIEDTKRWSGIVNTYIKSLNLDWGHIRNILDMKASYGGFAAALASRTVWVMNVVPINEPDTLPAIFDRGLFGIYHDWCESFSTYPRTYDLIHADHLLTKLTKRCNVMNTFVEIDRILRPEGHVIFRDKVENLKQVKPLMESLRWNVHHSYTQGLEELLVMQKLWWRPQANT